MKENNLNKLIDFEENPQKKKTTAESLNFCQTKFKVFIEKCK